MNPLPDELEIIIIREAAARTGDWLRRFPEDDALETMTQFVDEVRRELMQ